jgi:hypothetical protein
MNRLIVIDNENLIHLRYYRGLSGGILSLQKTNVARFLMLDKKDLVLHG